MMKKVMIYAYTQFNLGDDLFIKILCERYPETTFILHAPGDYQHAFKELDNIRVFPSDTFIVRGFNVIFKSLHITSFSRQLLAKSCDAVVHIGGSLFIQQEDWQKTLENTKAMRIKGKPFFLLGANFGPFQDEHFYLEHKRIFKTYTDICFREAHSYDLFKDLANVRMADDIVFQLDKKAMPRQEQSIVLSIIKPSIRKHLADYDAIYYRKMKEIAIYFIEKGYHVTLMSFCAYEGDDEAVERIMSFIPVNYANQVTKHFYKLNIKETLDIIASSRFVVASRFHAMILGWVFKKAVFPIVYSAKMTHVMQDVGFNGAYTDFKQLGTLKAEQVFASMETNSIDISKQIKHAATQFERLDMCLLKG